MASFTAYMMVGGNHPNLGGITGDKIVVPPKTIKGLIYMGFFVPNALSIFASAGEALPALVNWRKKSKGDAKTIVMELEDNYTYFRILTNPVGMCGLRTLSS